jgi:hypothetical protein
MSRSIEALAASVVSLRIAPQSAPISRRMALV